VAGNALNVAADSFCRREVAMRNVEIKVRLRDRARVERELTRLEARDLGVESQVDVFYASRRGRLKLRESSRDGAALILYERSDAPALRHSDYELVRIADANALRQVLDAAIGRTGEVRKRRQLFLLDNVRVHLDQVEQLGDFLELEAVVDATHPEPECRARAAALLERFGIAPGDHLAAAYVDLLPASPQQR
jgi:adenylate cyclase class 2